MNDSSAMEVRESLEDLAGVVHDDLLLFDPSMLEQILETSSVAVLLEDVDLVSMNLDTVILDDVLVVEHLHHRRLVLDLLVDGWEVGDVRESNLLDGHDGVLIHVVRGVDLSVGS